MAKKKRKRRKANQKWIRAVTVSLAVLVLLTAAGLYLGRVMEKRTYKLNYPNEIIAFADEFGVDRFLVAAVIHCESSNRETAVSPVGARGLMQVMPDTGEWIASKLEVEGYTEESLFDPEINIRFGCWYLNYLTDKFNSNRVQVLAAYNAGPGNVAMWLEKPEYAKDGELVEIPFPETANYVEKVQRVYEKYAQLYKNELG